MSPTQEAAVDPKEASPVCKDTFATTEPWSSSNIDGASAAEVKIVALLLLRCAKDEDGIFGLRAMMFQCTKEYEFWDADTSFEHVEVSLKTSPEVALWVKKAIASVPFSASTMEALIQVLHKEFNKVVGAGNLKHWRSELLAPLQLKARIFVLEAELALLNEHAENEAKKVAARATKTEDQHRQRTSAGKSKAYSAGAKSTVAKLNQAVSAATKAATKAVQQRFEHEVDRAVETGEFEGSNFFWGIYMVIKSDSRR